jgi:hypothetical protein
MDRKPFVKRSSTTSLSSIATGSSIASQDDDEKTVSKAILRRCSSGSSSVNGLKRDSKATLGSGTAYSPIAWKSDYTKTQIKPLRNKSSSRRPSALKFEAELEKPEFTPMPDLLPDFKLEPSISNSGFFKTSKLVLLGDVAATRVMVPKKGRSRISAVTSRNPVTILLGTNYDYFDQNLGHRIRWADTNEVWGPGWHPLKFMKSFESLVYCHKNARVSRVTLAQMAWIREHGYPILTASTNGFPWDQRGLTQEILTKLTAVR